MSKTITEPAKQIDVIHETDVLVVGSGPGGLAAALAAGLLATLGGLALPGTADFPVRCADRRLCAGDGRSGGNP